jgi:hypothetical protein
MDIILDQSFGKSTTLNEKEFISIVEHNKSEIFLYVLGSDLLVREATIFKKFD